MRGRRFAPPQGTVGHPYARMAPQGAWRGPWGPQGNPSSSVSTPLTIFGANLVGWWDASDLATLWQDSARTTPAASNADPVGAWDDKSGNSRHATQGTAGQRPTYRTNVQNGRSVVRFDGADDWLVTPSFATFPSKRGSIFAALKPTTVFADTVNALIGTYPAAATPFACGCSTNTLNPWNWYDGASAQRTMNAADVATAPQIISVVRDTDTHLATRLEGVDQAGATIANNQPSAAVVAFCAYTDGTFAWALDAYEIILVGVAASAAQITAIEAYLNSRWAAF